MNNKPQRETFEGNDWSMFMEVLGDTLQQRTQRNNYVYSNSYSNRNKTNITSIAIDYREIDKILDSYPQLIKEEYRGWFVKKLKEIGKQAFIEKAERAIKYGKNPQKLFTSMLG